MLCENTYIQSKQSKLKAFKCTKSDSKDRTLLSDATQSFECPIDNDHTLKWNVSNVGRTFRTFATIKHIDWMHNNSINRSKNLRRICLHFVCYRMKRIGHRRNLWPSDRSWEWKEAFHSAIKRMLRAHPWLRMSDSPNG